MSLCAYDSEVIAVCMNNAYFRPEFVQDSENGLHQMVDPSYKPMLANHYKLRMKKMHIYDRVEDLRSSSAPG